MSTRKNFIKTAYSYLGAGASEIKNLWRSRCGRTDWDGAFCAEFVSVCVAEAGLNNTMIIDNYSRSMYNYYKDKNKIITDGAEAGDLIFFGNSGLVDHVGIVQEVTPSGYSVIEAIGDPQTVQTNIYLYNNRRIIGFAHVLPSDIVRVDLPVLEYGSSGNTVKCLQQLLNLWMTADMPLMVDGVFGLNTYHKLQKYQNIRMQQASQYITIADGVCGSESWKDLLL